MANSFDGDLKRITIDSANPNVIVKDLYSEWKEWALTGNNLGYAQAFRTFGGDPTVAGQTAPAYYFLTNGWRIIVNGFDATFSYNLYTDEGENPVITLNGATALLNNSDVGIVKTELAKALDYAGVVHVDATHGTDGTEHPIGTAASPVKTISDAVTIANAYNFHEIYLHSGLYTLTNENIDDFLVHGDSPESVTLTFTGTSTYSGTRFRQVTLTGTMSNSRVDLERCVVDNLLDFNGTMFTTGIKNTLRIDPNGQATLIQCFSGHPGFTTPVLDMYPGQPTTIALRAYSGGLLVTNCDDPNDMGTIEYLSGKCTIDSTCTDGYLSIRGNALLTDNSIGANIDTSALVSELIDLAGVTINADALNIDVPTAVEIRAEMDANSTQLAQIVTNTTSISTDAPTVEEIRAYLDTNSTQLAQLITNTTNIATDAPTAAEIRAEIDLNSTQLSAIRTDINDIQVPDYSSQLTSIQTSVDGIPIAPDYTGQLSNIQNTVNSLDIPTATEIVYEMDTSSTRLATIQASESNILSAVSNVQTTVNGINVPDYSTELALLQTSVDGINDTDYSVTLADIQGAIGNIPTTDHSLQLDAIEADIAQIPTLNYTTTLLNIKNAVDNIPTVTYTIPDYSTELGSIQTAVDSKPSISAITTVVDNAVATVTPTDVPTAAEIRTEIDANSTKLQQISNDVNDIVTPTATQIRQEIDSNSSRLQSIKDTVESIPTTTYGTALSNIQSSVDGITVPTPPDYSTELTNIHNAVDGISVPNYSAELSNIQTAVDGITVPDYSVELGNIQTTVDGIPTTDYSATLSSIQSTVGSIPTTNYTTTLGTIQSLVSAIPTADHTSALSDIQTSVDAIPTVDNSTAIANVQSAVDAIPTETYTATLATLQGSVDAIPTATYTVPSLAEITTVVNTVNDNVDPKLAEINEGVRKASLKIPHSTTF